MVAAKMKMPWRVALLMQLVWQRIQIESHIVDQILSRSTSTYHGKQICSIDFYQRLQKVIEEMDLIGRETTGIKNQEKYHPHINSTPAGSSKPHSNTMVGFDGVKIAIMEKLIGQHHRQIIPIVGMGGIGKTTLARNIYVDQLIVQYFDIRVWATVSQEYNAKEIILQVLVCLKTTGTRESLSQMSLHELGLILHKSLSGRRYLIIMDDIWSIEAWDKVKFFFPDNNNGSRIIVTTRLSNLASELTGSCDHELMNFLDQDNSWCLFCNCVFGEEDCPKDLEDIGKKIAKNCKGLPLSITVIGGLLAKSEQKGEYWEYIAENLSSVVNLEHNESCLKILQLSYNQLPVHLKSCFLYMGVFPEDSEIRFSWLTKLLVAEGFLKPISGKSLEVVAEEYLKDLIDRNIILVSSLGSNGKIKLCAIHDLLRDLCIREAQKEKFLHVTRQYSVNIPHAQRCIAIHKSASKENYITEVLHAFQITSLVSSQSLVRSVICDAPGFWPSLNFRLLRVLKASDDTYPYYKSEPYFKEKTEPRLKTILQRVNLRFLSMEVDFFGHYRFPSSIHLLWNLTTLIVRHTWEVTAPSEIWKMPQLKHIEFDALYLPDPQMDDGADFVLWNLQTLLTIRRFNFSEETVKRIPNIKKLRVSYDVDIDGGSPYNYLDNLGVVHKLESFSCMFYSGYGPSRSYFLQNVTFPHSLKKLTLVGGNLHWEDMASKIGSLPHLQVLKLYAESFMGPEWETVEGRFCSLKFLLISYCSDLECWITDSTHFPRLEQLVLRKLDKLKEIPLQIGEIPTLQSIELDECSDSAIVSARNILKEQEDLGNVGLRVRVILLKKNEVLESLASDQFQVTIME